MSSKLPTIRKAYTLFAINDQERREIDRADTFAQVRPETLTAIAGRIAKLIRYSVDRKDYAMLAAIPCAHYRSVSAAYGERLNNSQDHPSNVRSLRSDTRSDSGEYGYPEWQAGVRVWIATREALTRCTADAEYVITDQVRTIGGRVQRAAYIVCPDCRIGRIPNDTNIDAHAKANLQTDDLANYADRRIIGCDNRCPDCRRWCEPCMCTRTSKCDSCAFGCACRCADARTDKRAEAWTAKKAAMAVTA